MKPKFLQNSKDMLSRSFNPAKCKTSLKLAAARLKLLRNKKDVQLTQMKREIAHLLESGEDQTARIRVEHVIREEKMMAAYDLLEIYCELIAVRLPVIESQKSCPADLKEAITSLAFASLRCGDVPELLDVRKHFTAKYGKDFTTAAIELRPDCGVSRLLVEKLSAAAPDVQTKIKVLSAIAKEHNISWDPPKLSEEKEQTPPSDLLSGSSNFGKKNEHYAEPPRPEALNFQSQPNNFDHNTPGASTEVKYEAKLPESSGERTQLSQGDTNSIPLDKKKWNMEFTDATSAAQAAAESAERASIAAQAAAELSRFSGIKQQNSPGSQPTEVYGDKIEGTVIDQSSESSKHSEFSEQAVNESSLIHSRLESDEIDRVEAGPIDPKKDAFHDHGHTGSKEYLYNQSSYSEPKNTVVSHGASVVDQCSPRNSVEDVNGVDTNMKEEIVKYEAETANDWPEKYDDFGEERIEKQDTVSWSHSHSNISDDYNIFADSKDQNLDHSAGEDSFSGINVSESLGETFHETTDVVFDKVESDNDYDYDHELVMGTTTTTTYDDQYPEIPMPSLGLKSQEHRFTNTDFASARITLSESLKPAPPLFFTGENATDDSNENLSVVDVSEVDNHVTAKFDVSDGETSETDDDTNNLEDSVDFLSAKNKSGDGSLAQQESQELVESPNADKGSSVFDRNEPLLSSDDESESDEIRIEVGKGSKRYVFDDDAPETLSPVKDDDFGNEPIPEIGKGLSFGKLTGGLRHKGYNRLSFLKNGLDVSSSDKEDTQETTDSVTRSEAATLPEKSNVVERPKISTVSDYKTSVRTQDMKLESDSDTSEDEEPLQRSSGYKREGFSNRTSVETVQTKSNLGTSKPILSSDDSDLDDYTPKKSLAWKSNLRGGMSRRTKASASGSATNSSSKTRLKSEALDSDDSATDSKLTPSINFKTSKESDSSSKSSDTSLTSESKHRPFKEPDTSKSSSLVMQQPKAKISSETNIIDASHERESVKAQSPESQEEIESSSIMKPSQKSRKSSPPKSSRYDSPNAIEDREKPNSMKATSTSDQDPKKSVDSSLVEEPSSHKQKKEASNSSESPEIEAKDKTPSDTHDSPKKAGHVHPKLPDYDMLLQYLGKSRS